MLFGGWLSCASLLGKKILSLSCPLWLMVPVSILDLIFIQETYQGWPNHYSSPLHKGRWVPRTESSTQDVEKWSSPKFQSQDRFFKKHFIENVSELFTCFFDLEVPVYVSVFLNVILFGLFLLWGGCPLMLYKSFKITFLHFHIIEYGRDKSCSVLLMKLKFMASCIQSGWLCFKLFSFLEQKYENDNKNKGVTLLKSFMF